MPLIIIEATTLVATSRTPSYTSALNPRYTNINSAALRCQQRLALINLDNLNNLVLKCST